MMWAVEGTEAYDVLAAAIPSEEAISAVKELAELQAMVAALKAAMETASEYFPTEVVLNKTVIEIKVGETFQLEATVLPAKASQAIEWYSSDWKGNTITVENGLVTALAEGEVTVTACSVADWNLYAECVIKVVAAPVEDGIDNVEAETETVIYDLSGRRVTEMKKGGIYIVNGKKVIK